MMEMIVFALVFVVAQSCVAIIVTNYMMKKYLNKEFVKNYTKMGMEVASELVKEMESDYLEES